MAKSDGLLFKYRSPMSPYSLQSHGWWCGTDGARVTSRLFSGPCKQSRPMTCSIMPFEEEASSVTTKKNQGVPLLTIGSSSWLQRGVQLPFCFTAGPFLPLHKMQVTGALESWVLFLCLPLHSGHIYTVYTYSSLDGPLSLVPYFQSTLRRYLWLPVQHLETVTTAAKDKMESVF
ncbi:uncharacterized protein PRD47_003923 isoform 1-T1 [Ara ararauna]